ncbi:hypothetical protein Trydic_g14588 [Trypoxylus dichotomus]
MHKYVRGPCVSVTRHARLDDAVPVAPKKGGSSVTPRKNKRGDVEREHDRRSDVFKRLPTMVDASKKDFIVYGIVRWIIVYLVCLFELTLILGRICGYNLELGERGSGAFIARSMQTKNINAERAPVNNNNNNNNNNSTGNAASPEVRVSIFP